MKLLASILIVLGAVSPLSASVLVTTPTPNETLGPKVTFVATANSTTCSKGVSAMGIYVDSRLAYTVSGTSINTALILSTGKHDAVVQEWDFCGGSTTMHVPVSIELSDAVWVTSPTTNSSEGTLVNYVATATSNCPSGVTAMGVYLDNKLIYKVEGGALNTEISLPVGMKNTVVQEWDGCGQSATKVIPMTVSGNRIDNIQAASGWYSWAQLAPTYQDCSFPCAGVTWGMTQGVNNPSLSGKASKVTLGGTTPYSDVLYANHLIGPFSSQGFPDLPHAMLGSLHNFTYDADFYVTNGDKTQAMEFDINWFMDTVGMTFGTECRIEGGNEWDIWDNANAKWVPTGIACNPTDNQWNHVRIDVERGANNILLYKSIMLNGKTSLINKSYVPFTVPADWYGITVNYQMDGDHDQSAIVSYLDNLTFLYW